LCTPHEPLPQLALPEYEYVLPDMAPACKAFRALCVAQGWQTLGVGAAVQVRGQGDRVVVVVWLCPSSRSTAVAAACLQHAVSSGQHTAQLPGSSWCSCHWQSTAQQAQRMGCYEVPPCQLLCLHEIRHCLH
jgi:hypothetical protein